MAKQGKNRLSIDRYQGAGEVGSRNEGRGNYPASFFNQTFQLTHKVLKELHTLEEFQLEALRKQMEEHQRLIDSIPVSKPLQMPEVQPAPEVSPTIEVVQVQEPVVEEPIVVEPIVEK